ncbi:MAG: hypothetical protein JWO05_3686 [Gemmatimonadetes bacterium]|nr:hypothetical protein [Gemmatimonadota bacterium]
MPQLLLEQAGLTGDVELTASAGRITIAAPTVVREGWTEAAAEIGAAEEERVGTSSGSTFDDSEWEWM